MYQERPYSHKSTDDLEVISTAHWNNIQVLNLIKYELKFRRKPKAQSFLIKISSRIQDLEKSTGQKTPQFISTKFTNSTTSDNQLSSIIKYPEGVLKYLGYRVGEKGLPGNQRQQILKQALTEGLPFINSHEYMSEWGEPGTQKRFEKIVDSLSTFIRNSERKNPISYQKAIQDWESDIQFLKSLYTPVPDYYYLYLKAQAKIAELTSQLHENERYLQDNEQAKTSLAQANRTIEAYQAEINNLKESTQQSYNNYLKLNKEYQQISSLYENEKIKAGQLIVQVNQWEQIIQENDEKTSKLLEFQQLVQSYGIKFKELETKIAENYILYLNEQENYQSAQSRLAVAQNNIQKYEVEAERLKQVVADEKQNYQQISLLYEEEKRKFGDLLTKYEEVSCERDKYLVLFNQAQDDLKFERRSKASIKGWETRRKTENQRLKKEVADMVVILQNSLATKDEAINNLYMVAQRMDRIQSLVDSVEEEDSSNNPVGVIQKFKRIWLAIKEILSE